MNLKPWIFFCLKKKSKEGEETAFVEGQAAQHALKEGKNKEHIKLCAPHAACGTHPAPVCNTGHEDCSGEMSLVAWG